jgi:hypothetical protein
MHRCQTAEKLYTQGCYIVFRNQRLGVWVLAQPHLDRWYTWHHDPTQPHPLASRIDDDYAACAYVDFCPWCGVRLVDDPDFAGADEVYQLLTRKRPSREAPRLGCKGNP